MGGNLITKSKDTFGRDMFQINSNDQGTDALRIMINDSPKKGTSGIPNPIINLFLCFRGDLGVVIDKAEVKQLIKILYGFYVTMDDDKK